MSWFALLNDARLLVLAVPALGITVAVLVALLRSSLAHRERMAMIQRGLHPDDPRARRSSRSEELPVA